MTLVEATALIGSTVSIPMESVRVNVRVMDAKVAYGRFRFLISPVDGDGEMWVLADRLGVA